MSLLKALGPQPSLARRWLAMALRSSGFKTTARSMPPSRHCAQPALVALRDAGCGLRHTDADAQRVAHIAACGHGTDDRRPQFARGRAHDDVGDQLLVAVRKRGFLAAAGWKRLGNEVVPVVQPIPSSSNAMLRRRAGVAGAGLNAAVTSNPRNRTVGCVQQPEAANQFPSGRTRVLSADAASGSIPVACCRSPIKPNGLAPCES